MTSRKEILDLLKEVPLFSNFSEKNLKSVVKTAKEKDFDPDKPIIREGDQSTVGFYLILDGQVEVKQDGRVLSKLGKSQFFGEMSALDGQPRSADVIPTVKTKCLVLTAWDLRGLIKSHPDLAMIIIGELARRLRQTNMAFTK